MNNHTSKNWLLIDCSRQLLLLTRKIEFIELFLLQNITNSNMLMYRNKYFLKKCLHIWMNFPILSLRKS